MFLECTPHDDPKFHQNVRGEAREACDWLLDFVENLQYAATSSMSGLAADGCLDPIAYQHLANTLKTASSLKKTVKDLEATMLEITEQLFSEDVYEGRVVVKGALRTIRVEVSPGMLNQHLLTLTTARKRGVVESDEKFSITTTSGDHFSTELCQPGSRFRERGEIRKFYAQNGVKKGDIVVLDEQVKGQWILETLDQHQRRKEGPTPNEENTVQASNGKALQ